MSIWSACHATFHLTGHPDGPMITEIFGRQHLWEDNWDEIPDDHLPMGSEGSLRIQVLRNPHKPLTTVKVYGNLRDVAFCDGLKEWFDKCCKCPLIYKAEMHTACYPERNDYKFSR